MATAILKLRVPPSSLPILALFPLPEVTSPASSGFAYLRERKRLIIHRRFGDNLFVIWISGPLSSFPALRGFDQYEMTTNFAVPVNQRYFEDYVSGTAFEYGQISLSADEIIEFARRFDPQPIHVDPEVAAGGPFGGLIASGWHTAGVMMRMLADNFISHVASMASPGVDEIRWLKPVRPGDTLSIRVTVLETKRSNSKPDRGVVRSLVEVLNQNREVVMTLRPMSIVRCRS
jgi:acyl dehydratase